MTVCMLGSSSESWGLNSTQTPGYFERLSNLAPVDWMVWMDWPTIGTDRNVEATMFDALLHAFVAIPAQALQLTEIERVHIAFVPLDVICNLGRRHLPVGCA